MMVTVHLKKQANLWIYENLETRGKKKNGGVQYLIFISLDYSQALI
jgi:hypothetical protein